jgi:hypothetical protein
MRRRAPVLGALAVALALLVLAAVAAGLAGQDSRARTGTATPQLAAACPDNQVSASPFVDVAAGDPAELALSCLVDYGLVVAAPGASYAPDAVVTHGCARHGARPVRAAGRRRAGHQRS